MNDIQPEHDDDGDGDDSNDDGDDDGDGSNDGDGSDDDGGSDDSNGGDGSNDDGGGSNDGGDGSDGNGGGEAIGYADAMQELEQVLRDLEGDDLDVDMLAARVERASFLIGLCRKRISAARVQVERVVANLDSEDEADTDAEDD